MKSHARDNLNPYALFGREVISRNHSKRQGKRIVEKNPNHTQYSVWQRTYFQEPHKKTKKSC